MRRNNNKRETGGGRSGNEMYDDLVIKASRPHELGEGRQVVIRQGRCIAGPIVMDYFCRSLMEQRKGGVRGIGKEAESGRTSGRCKLRHTTSSHVAPNKLVALFPRTRKQRNQLVWCYPS